jgi:hypothetical protein
MATEKPSFGQVYVGETETAGRHAVRSHMPTAMETISTPRDPRGDDLDIASFEVVLPRFHRLLKLISFDFARLVRTGMVLRTFLPMLLCYLGDCRCRILRSQCET